MKSICSIPAVAICLFCSLTLLWGEEDKPEGEKYRPSPQPVWQAGDWWITETHALQHRTPCDASGPTRLVDTLYYHKWTVSGIEKVDKTECWVLEIRAHNLPKDVVNDQKDEYLLRLYLKKEDFALIKADHNTRGGYYKVTGEKRSQYTQEFENGESVSLNWPITCPPDFPQLPDTWYEKGICSEHMERKYVDERSDSKSVQFIKPFVSTSADKTPSMLIILSSERLHANIRTMLWEVDKPWWSEWRCQSSSGDIGDIWYSKMIDWKGKPGAEEKQDESSSSSSDNNTPEETPSPTSESGTPDSKCDEAPTPPEDACTPALEITPSREISIIPSEATPSHSAQAASAVSCPWHLIFMSGAIIAAGAAFAFIQHKKHNSP